MLQLSHSSYFACWRGNKNYIRGSKYSLQCSLTFIFFSYHLAIILVYEHHAIFFYCKVYLWILASQNHVFFVINQKSWRSIFHSGQQWNEYFPSALIHYFTLLQNCGRCKLYHSLVISLVISILWHHFMSFSSFFFSSLYELRVSNSFLSKVFLFLP